MTSRNAIATSKHTIRKKVGWKNRRASAGSRPSRSRITFSGSGKRCWYTCVSCADRGRLYTKFLIEVKVNRDGKIKPQMLRGQTTRHDGRYNIDCSTVDDMENVYVFALPSRGSMGARIFWFARFINRYGWCVATTISNFFFSFLIKLVQMVISLCWFLRLPLALSWYSNVWQIVIIAAARPKSAEFSSTHNTCPVCGEGFRSISMSKLWIARNMRWHLIWRLYNIERVRTYTYSARK